MTRYLEIVLLSLIIVSLINEPLFGQSNEVLVVKETEDFDLNGKGTAKNWSATDWVDIHPRDKIPGEVDLNTQLKALYSTTGIYFLFECEDQVLSATMDADFMKLWKEDVVEIFLWPDETSPVYFEYEIPPLNYELPILISNEEGDLVRWRPFMYESDRKTRHQTHIEGGKKESGASIAKWTAEFFFPYKLLRPLKNISPESGTEWRANFYRVDYDNGSTAFMWQPVNGTFHSYNRFGTLLFE